METANIAYYVNRNVPWTKEDVSIIENLYNGCNTIMDIAIVVKKTPGQIAFKLKQLGLVSNHMRAKGYHDYVKSKLYYDIVEEGIKQDEAKKKAKLEKRKITLNDVFERILALEVHISEIKQQLEIKN